MKHLVCSICGKLFDNAKSVTNHRRHHDKKFSQSWSNKMSKYRVKRHSEETKKKISKSLRTSVNIPDSSRARARYDNKKRPCDICGSLKSEIHHKDGDVYNNDKNNITFLCRKHHMIADGRLKRFIKMAKIKNKTWIDRDDEGRWLPLNKQ